MKTWNPTRVRARKLQGWMILLAGAAPVAAASLIALLHWVLPEMHVWLSTALGSGIGIAVYLSLLWLMVWKQIKATDSAARLRAEEILANANEGVIAVNRYGLIQSINAAAERMFGYAASELVNAPLTKLIAERAATESQKLFHDSLPVGTILGLAASAREVTGIHKHGEMFPVELTVSSVMTEDGPMVVGFARDISKRKRAQRYLTAHYTATCVMANANSLGEAIHPIIQAVCQSLRWDLGAFWKPRPEGRELACHALYQDPAASQLQILDPATLSCKTDEGVVGLAWSAGKTQWLERGLTRQDCPWVGSEPECMASAIALPVMVGKRVFGVLAFYNRKPQKRDEQLWDILKHLADQFGQFIARKRDEDRLHRSEDRFRQLAENIHDVFWMADVRDDRLLYLSPSFEGVWGRPCQETRSRSDALAHVHPDDRLAVHAALDRQRVGEETNLEYRVVRPDGSVRWVCDRAFPVHDAAGRNYRVAGIATDITMERQTREALRETTQTLQALVKSAPLAIYIIDVNGHVRLWNPAAERIFGWRESELLGQPLPPIHDLENAEDEHNPDSSLGLPRRCRRKDGKIVETNLATAPLLDGAGTLLGVMGIITDLTEKRRLEEKLRQAQKMEAVGQLAGGIAHDFNNLLTIILGYNELLLLKLSPEDPMRESLDQIRQAGQRACSLTNRLLAFGRKQTLQVQVLDLNAVIQDMAKIVGRVIGEDIEVLLKPGDGLHRIKADPVQIEQILLNLATNARDAMPSGGLLTIETTNVEFDEHSRPAETPAGVYAMLAVTDTGCGMDEKTRAKVFEPFFTTKEIGKGTGLGLATVYGIVKQSGGHVEIESEPRRGTTVRVYLPASRDSQALPRSRGSLSSMPDGKETVLLVEDEDGVRNLIRDALKAKGYNVLETGSPEEALRLCESYRDKIALLVTDVVMPQMNGKQLAERALQLQSRLKVLYMSGYTDGALGTQNIIPTGVPFLHKPITLSKLGKKVREVLDGPAPLPMSGAPSAN